MSSILLCLNSKITNFGRFYVVLLFEAHPSHFFRKHLCKKEKRYVRDPENPSHIPPFSLPSSLP